MNRKFFLLTIIITAFFFVSCDPPEAELGDIIFKFEFNVDGEKVTLDELKYTNEAGNLYMINDIQMILSKVKFVRSDNSEVIFNTEQFVHYLDFENPKTHTWTIPKNYEGGIYKSIGFTFGLDETMNVSGLFKNPPISDMFWPEVLGGGYHYMKLNCKWQATDNKEAFIPFNFHLGRAPFYEETANSNNNDNPVTFLDNHFEVEKQINFEIEERDNIFIISINLNNWFRDPHIIDFEKYIDVSIMQNASIQVMAKQNGENVFEIVETLRATSLPIK
ncbi:hypothetical protein LJC73_05740 [Bacteroidales bacterium OttesenSCG-928-L14]|nr:hypothetical protein [Bacteroidales bacterium OttesenSCG-928-L14]